MEIMIGRWRVAIEQIRPSPPELAITYNNIAHSWDRSIGRLGYPAAYRHLMGELQQAGHLTALPAGARVLDAGIGTGALSAALLDRLPRPVELHGIDLSDNMLQEAQQRLTPTNSRLILRRLNLLELDEHEPAASFDLVMAAHTLEHLSDPQAGLAALVRVLKPGRPLLLIISRRHLLSSWLAVQWAISRTTADDLTACFAAAGLHPPTFWPLRSGFWPRWMSIACLALKKQTNSPILNGPPDPDILKGRSLNRPHS